MQPRHATAFLMAFACAVAAHAQTPASPAYTAGQKVEVREGDVWSAATIVAHEGRRYQIRYDGADATTEWVATDRLRTPGAPPPVPSPSPAPTAPPVPTTAPAGTTHWTVGQKAEIKWGGMWFTGTITDTRGKWFQVYYDRMRSKEWVEPWRLRDIGSTEDNVGVAQPHHTSGNDGPPSPEPPPAPPAHTFRRPTRMAGQSEEDTAFKTDPAYRASTLDGVREITFARVPWAVTLTPPPPSLALHPIPLHPSQDAMISMRFAEQSALAIAPAAPLAAVSYNTQQPAFDSPTTLELLDLRAGASRFTKPVGNNLQLLALSPDGKRAAFRSTRESPHTKNRLEVWSLDGPEPVRQLLIFPYAGQSVFQSDIISADFVDSTHLLTASDGDSVAVLWEVPTGKAVWKCTLDSMRPALSPDCRYAALEKNDRVAIVEAGTGVQVGDLPLEGLRHASYAFSPSGRQLLASSAGSFRLWNLADGMLISDFSLDVPAKTCVMTADNYALVDERLLIDLPRGLVVWNYTLPKASIAQAQGSLLAALGGNSRGGPASLESFQIPDAPTAQQIADALAHAKDLYVLKPGTAVQFTSTIGGDANAARKAEADLRASLKASGFVITDNAPVHITASTSAGAAERKTYESIASPVRQIDNVIVTPQISSVTIEVDGKTVWHRSTTFTPGFGVIHMKGGESAQQAIDEQSKPNVTYFSGVRFPRYLARPSDKPGFGTSTLGE